MIISYFLLPIGVPFFWLVGFFIFVTIHGRVLVKIVLPTIPEGTFSILSEENKIYSLRLSADNIAKYWCKSLEWIPFLSQLFLYKQSLQSYGVKFGKNAYLATETRIDGVPLIEVGDNFFIGPRGVLGAHINLKGGEIMYKKLKIGNNCFVGSLSVLTPGCSMGDNSILGGVSITLPDTHIPENETWIGMPAKAIKKDKP